MHYYHPLVKEKYAQIGSNELGYITNALGCVAKALNDIAADDKIRLEVREKAAFALANLLISDYAGDIDTSDY